MLVNPLLTLNYASLPLTRSRPGSAPTLPKHGGGKELPTPPVGVALKHIALGFGIQNYSYSDGSPVSTGALAVLYDITNLHPSNKSPNTLSETDFKGLTATVLETCRVPLNLNPDGSANSLKPFTKPAPMSFSGHSIPFLGHHFFDSSGIPIFDLGNQLLRASIIDYVEVPTPVVSGPDGTGAISWLYLGDMGESVGISYVYCVLTSGGQSHGYPIHDDGGDCTPYAAQYWFYG